MPSPRLDLPYLSVAQAQKEVTHNDALNRLDLVVQARVLDRHLAMPPAGPVQGDAYLVAAGAGGDWAGQDGVIAAWYGTAWVFRPPWPGFALFVADEALVLRYDGVAWAADAGFTGAAPAVHGHVVDDVAGLPAALDGKQPLDPALTTLAGLGGGARTALGLGTGDAVAVDRLGLGGATADATNRLSLNSPAVLLNHAGAGIQAKLNKSSAGDTATCLFQTGFSGRAEFGLAGSDDFTLKVSPDGAAWVSALSIDRTSGALGLATPLGLAQGGTGATGGSAARGNLGLAIGSDVQAYSATLGVLAGVAPAADKGLYFTGLGSAAGFDLTAAARSLLDDASPAAMLATLGALPQAGGTMTGTLNLTADTDSIVATRAAFQPTFAGRRAKGSLSSPTGVGPGDALVSLNGAGYTAANAYSAYAAGIFLAASETFGASAQGTYLDVQLTPNGTTSRGSKLLVTGDGQLQMGGSNTVIDGNRHFVFRSYTIATLPLASANTGRAVYCADLFGSTGGLMVANGACWLPLGDGGGQSFDGDSDATVVPLVAHYNRDYVGTLTANRTINLSTVNAYPGVQFHIRRTAAGAFNLSIGGLKSLAQNQWCTVRYYSGAWILQAFGNL